MNVKNRTLFIADNLDILRGINSECIDLIYLDPPFNSKKQYKAPIGSLAEGATFKDIWTDEDIKYEWHGQIAEEHQELYQIIQAAEDVYDKSMKIYLMAIAVRMFEMKRILKPIGTLYLHCDDTAAHYLKMMMDSIFGKDNFRNEIIWQRAVTSKGNLTKGLARDSDILLRYSKSHEFVWNPEAVTIPYDMANLDEKTKKQYNQIEPETGRLVSYTALNSPIQDPDSNLTYEVMGVVRTWRWSKERMMKELKAGRVVQTRPGNVPRYKRYLDEQKGKPLNNIWIDIPNLTAKSKERTGWPTQKPLTLLHRIIKASSNEGDVVLDPFCGGATACVAAEQLQRQWIGIDISPSAEVITKIRLTEEVAKSAGLFNPLADVIIRSEAPIRTDISDTASQMRLPKAHVHKHQLYGEQEGKCAGCHYFLPFRNLTIDPIVPQSKGGTDAKENLQLLCNACNSTKSTRSQSEFLELLREQGISS